MNGRNSRSCHWVEMRVSSMVLESGQWIWFVGYVKKTQNGRYHITIKGN
jgi:hypothetical protein